VQTGTHIIGATGLLAPAMYFDIKTPIPVVK
jgi:hypothetical protein